MDYTPLQAGLDRFVKLRYNVAYVGSEKLLEQQREGCRTKFVTLAIEPEDADPFGNEPVYAKGGGMVGRLSSGGYGHRIGQGLGLGYLEAEFTEVGTELEVLVLDKKLPAEVVGESPYDPKNEKLRA